jgi:hypothetical protein
MRLLQAVALALFGMTVATVPSLAQPQEPPRYIMDVYKAFWAPGDIPSRPNGDLFVPDDEKENVVGFHHFGLRTENPRKLRFNFSCYYWDRQKQKALRDGPLNSGYCPTGGIAVSVLLLAFRVNLAGTDKDKYCLRYVCKENNTFYEKRAGQWCGTPVLQQPRHLEAMNFSLRRKVGRHCVF